MPVTPAEIDRRFFGHKMTLDKQVDNASALRRAFVDLANLIVEATPDNPREQATALTHLETASFFAIAGVARPQAPAPTYADLKVAR